MTIEESTMEKTHNSFLIVINMLLEKGVNPFEIAGVMANHSLCIYKSLLNEEEYGKMVDAISESRDRIVSFKQDTGAMH